MSAMSKVWPGYFSDLLHIENKENHIGIVTLWAKKEIYIKRIDSSLYNSIGQMYSREEGLSALVRNLLANKNITDLVIVGVDLNHCSNALIDLFKNGVDEKNEVIGEHYSKIDDEVSKESIDNLLKNVKFHDLRSVKDPDELNNYLKNIKKREPYGEFELFPEAELKIPEVFPSDHCGFKVRGSHIKDVWPKILKTIDKFGDMKKSQYGDMQKEVISLVSIVEDEDPDEPLWSENFDFTKDELKDYIPQVTTPNEVEGLDYTYGQRLMKFRNIDQIKNIVEQLKKENFTRRAVACTWDVMTDYKNPKAPCLDLVQALVQDNKLYLTCYFRSNDMYGAWPRNAFALRKLQKDIAQEVGIDMGSLIIISNSAHYYERSFNKVADIIEVEKSKIKWNPDPFGTIVITINNGLIFAQHMDVNGKKLEVIEGKTAMEVYRKIADEMKISDISHALDIGCELQKAEIALKAGKEYRQDNVLELD